MSDSTPDTLSKAERLAIGGDVAPVLRRRAAAPRRVTLVGKDGKPTGTTTDVEVAKSLLARSEIEFSVQEGERPKYVKCQQCGLPVPVYKTGPVPKVCKSGTHPCTNCGTPLRMGGNKCGFGRTCRKCHAPDHLRSVRFDTTKMQRHTDDEIRAALAKSKNFSQAAKTLGVWRSGLEARAKRLGIRPGGSA